MPLLLYGVIAYMICIAFVTLFVLARWLYTLVYKQICERCNCCCKCKHTQLLLWLASYSIFRNVVQIVAVAAAIFWCEWHCSYSNVLHYCMIVFAFANFIACAHTQNATNVIVNTHVTTLHKRSTIAMTGIEYVVMFAPIFTWIWIWLDTRLQNGDWWVADFAWCIWICFMHIITKLCVAQCFVLNEHSIA